MKYLLGIGFVISQKYKKDPVVRIHIDDLFLDELTLVDCPNYSKLWKRDHNIWIYQRAYATYSMRHSYVSHRESNLAIPPFNLFDTARGDQFPKNFKLYEIDESQLSDKKQLRIQIENSDSNYTNGFMTKTTLLNFCAFLLPINFLKFFTKDGEDMREQFNTAIVDNAYRLCNLFHDEHWVTEHNVKNEIGYLLLNGNLVFGESAPHKLLDRMEGFPFAIKHFWNGKVVDPYYIGGSGNLTVDLITRAKSGVVTFDTYDSEFSQLQKQNQILHKGGFFISEKFFSMAHKNMFDKYLQNENL